MRKYAGLEIHRDAIQSSMSCVETLHNVGSEKVANIFGDFGWVAISVDAVQHTAMFGTVPNASATERTVNRVMLFSLRAPRITRLVPKTPPLRAIKHYEFKIENNNNNT